MSVPVIINLFVVIDKKLCFCETTLVRLDTLRKWLIMTLIKVKIIFAIDESLAWKRTSNYNLVDDCILLFRQEGCKVVATWHERKS